jgi:hypothetical protein
MRLQDLRLLNSEGEKYEPDALKEMYPENKELFSYPMTKLAADSIVEESNIRANLEEEIAAGPKGAIPSTLNFIAGMIPHAVDPTDFVIGAGVGKALTMSVKAAKVIAMLSKTGAGKFGVAVGEAAVGNVLAEPATFAAAAAEGREYGLDDAFINSVGGAVLGVSVIKGAAYGVGKILPTKTGGITHVDAPKAVNEVLSKGTTAIEVTATIAEAQLNAGRMVDVSHVTKDLAREIAPSIPKVEIESIGAGTRAYGVVVKETTMSMGDNLGDDFIYLNMDKQVATGHAGSKYNSVRGELMEVEFKEPPRLIDADRPLTEDLRQMFDAEEGTTLKQILEGEDVGEISRALSEMGYDGYFKENNVALFGGEKLTEVSRSIVDTESVPRASREELIEINKVETARQDNPFGINEKDLDVDSRLLMDTPAKDFKELDEAFDQASQEAPELVERGFLDEESAKAYKEAGMEGATMEDVKKAFKSSIACMTRGVS